MHHNRQFALLAIIAVAIPALILLALVVLALASPKTGSAAPPVAPTPTSSPAPRP